MPAIKTIFVADMVAFTGDIAIDLISNNAKKPRYSAVVTDGADVLQVADESANVKLFKDAGAAAKFVGKFCTESAVVSITQPVAEYVPNGLAGDPSTALAKAIDHVTKSLAKATATKTKIDSDVAAATALGWATGTAAQQTKLANDTGRSALVGGLVTALQAKLDALNAQV